MNLENSQHNDPECRVYKIIFKVLSDLLGWGFTFGNIISHSVLMAIN